MLYKDLRLKELREKNDLDFAHFTYLRGMCSCCYGPRDFPKCYWKDRKIPNDDDYTYLLFKNAYNGSGIVTRNDEIEDLTYIEWGFPMEKMEDICRDLLDQLTDEYYLEVPTSQQRCIAIRKMQDGKIFIHDKNCYVMTKTA